MKKITFFLGAGASKAYGLPLTDEIFPGIWKKINRKTTKRSIRLLKLIKALYPGLSSSARQPKKLPGITDVLSMIDHFIMNGQVPVTKLTLDDLRKCRQDLEFEIITLIDEESDYSEESSEMDELYEQFIDMLLKLNKKYKIDVISTNYDYTVEYGLYDRGKLNYEKFIQKTDFGFKWRDPESGKLYTIPENPTFSIYKLHGSVLWLTCELCNQVYINIEGPIALRASEKTWDGNTCHCGHARLVPVIVSPSLARNVSDTNLKYVWNSAVESLRTSSEWFVIGYSFPMEDLNIRSIFTRAINAHESKPRINVIQLGDEAKDRYKSLFGKITYYEKGLNRELIKLINKKY